MSSKKEREYPFDRVMIMAQIDGSWISIYIRKGFETQEQAMEDVKDVLGETELYWSEVSSEEMELNNREEPTEAEEKIETDLPDFMKDVWKDDDTS